MAVNVMIKSGLEFWSRVTFTSCEGVPRAESCEVGRLNKSLLCYMGLQSNVINFLPPKPGLDIQTARRNFKRPKNREDCSDLHESLTDRIAALKSIISEIFRAARLQKQRFQKFFRASCGLDIYR